MNKYLKVMFGNKGTNYEYKIDELNIANNWNPTTYDPKNMGGFNFSTEDKILRWLVRGDTIYDVVIPEDAQVIDCPSESAPHGVFRCNKIILTNPRTMTDELAMDLYLKSNLPEKSYYKSLAGVAIRGYRNTSLKIIEDKVNKDNIELVLSEIEEFVKPYQDIKDEQTDTKVYDEVMEILNRIKNQKISRLFDAKNIISIICSIIGVIFALFGLKLGLDSINASEWGVLGTIFILPSIGALTIVVLDFLITINKIKKGFIYSLISSLIKIVIILLLILNSINEYKYE